MTTLQKETRTQPQPTSVAIASTIDRHNRIRTNASAVHTITFLDMCCPLASRPHARIASAMNLVLPKQTTTLKMRTLCLSYLATCGKCHDRAQSRPTDKSKPNANARIHGTLQSAKAISKTLSKPNTKPNSKPMAKQIRKTSVSSKPHHRNVSYIF